MIRDWLLTVARRVLDATRDLPAPPSSPASDDWIAEAVVRDRDRLLGEVKRLTRELDAAQQLAQANADMLKDTLDQRDQCAESMHRTLGERDEATRLLLAMQEERDALRARLAAASNLLQRIWTLTHDSKPQTGDYREYLKYNAETAKTWSEIRTALTDSDAAVKAFLVQRDASIRTRVLRVADVFIRRAFDSFDGKGILLHHVQDAVRALDTADALKDEQAVPQ